MKQYRSSHIGYQGKDDFQLKIRLKYCQFLAIYKKKQKPKK